ncbi:MAG TPA: dynamin family protein [Anaerolineales bacterium]|nr:dynamin family protein [Anaerolineales bacterium]
MDLLTPTQETMLADERHLLAELRAALQHFGASREDLAKLEESIRQLDDFFLLVIVGEYNTGKSTIINALLGQKVLADGYVPTTRQINILRHGDSLSQQQLPDNTLLITAPVDVLREVSVVDTPGANAIFREHEQLTSDFVPRSDLVLFCISADRAFSESERAFLEPIRDWGKKVVVVLNKIDYLENEQELAQIIAFVRDSTQRTLGIQPQIFPVSAQKALRAKQGQPQLWQASQFEALENFITHNLDAHSRLQLKLGNPLGVGQHLVQRYLKATSDQQLVLTEDLTMLNNVERQQSVYSGDLQRDFELRLKAIDNVLLQMEQRGHQYFEELFQLRRVFDLFKKEEIQQGFERQVVADTPKQIESKVSDLIDWLIESDLRQWQGINDYLAEQRRKHRQNLIGDEPNATFNFQRGQLLDGLGRDVQRVVEEYNITQESAQMAESTQNAVATMAALQVGAVSLGALLAVIVGSSVAMDATFILSGSLLAAVGLFIIPARRRQADQELRERINTMRENLVSTLRRQFTREAERINNRLQVAVSPYARFVRSEQTRLQTAEKTLQELNQKLADLQSKITKL